MAAHVAGYINGGGGGEQRLTATARGYRESPSIHPAAVCLCVPSVPSVSVCLSALSLCHLQSLSGKGLSPPLLCPSLFLCLCLGLGLGLCLASRDSLAGGLN